MPCEAREDATVLDRAQACKKSRAPLLPRRRSGTVAHRVTAPEPPQQVSRPPLLTVRASVPVQRRGAVSATDGKPTAPAGLAQLYFPGCEANCRQLSSR